MVACNDLKIYQTAWQRGSNCSPPRSQCGVMLLQTNSYIVPREKRDAHAKLLAQFRQTLARLGCDLFEVYEQADPNWAAPAQGDARFVQIMRFRDRGHQTAVQAAEQNDPSAQRMINAFCELINFPYQQEQGLFAVGFYTEMATDSAPNPAIPPPAQASANAADVEAYLQRELDEIIATFGDPRQLFKAPARANAASAPAPPGSKEQNPFPRLAQPDVSAAAPADEELDSLLQEQFAPASPGESADADDSELGRLLDEGLAEDELDVPLPAELLDEDEVEGSAAVRQPAVESGRPSARSKRG